MIDASAGTEANFIALVLVFRFSSGEKASLPVAIAAGSASPNATRRSSKLAILEIWNQLWYTVVIHYGIDVAWPSDLCIRRHWRGLAASDVVIPKRVNVRLNVVNV